MPKVTNTRKQRANELVDRLKKGPATDLTFFYSVELTPAQKELIRKHFKEGYKFWSQTWILEQIKLLIPELKE